MIKETYHLTTQAVNNEITTLKKMMIPFTLSLSNYTTTLTAWPGTIAARQMKFIKNELSLKTFAAGAKVKADLRKLSFIPFVEMHELNYYDTAIKKDTFLPEAFNIDFKSAYATILYNDKFISPATFEYLNRLDKIERLAAVGMCASKKEIYHHDKRGRITKLEEELNPLAPFFFHCVKQTASLINQVRNEIIHPDNFLFSWVDGIYYQDDKNTSIATWYINEVLKMKCSQDTLKNFCVKMDRDFIRINFDTLTAKNKNFIIPIPESKLKQQIINHLLNKKYEHTHSPNGRKNSPGHNIK